MEQQLKEKGFILDKYGPLENIILTNDFFNRIKMAEYGAFFFGWFGLGCCMIHYEFNYYINSGDFIDPNLLTDNV